MHIILYLQNFQGYIHAYYIPQIFHGYIHAHYTIPSKFDSQVNVYFDKVFLHNSESGGKRPT